ncbi:MAG: RNA 2',3'-cyclic phosphodiesterase [Lachnospiraceae bacterium]|nr:RNA 2',3'-cyclic phosphodiesterase [Lachnospiraceae bacterium]
MRLFIAIRLSDEMKKELTGTLHELKKAGVSGKYVPVQNLHLTLAFIGEMESAEPVKEALRGIKYKSFRLSLSELSAFGDILHAGVKGNQGLSAAARAVREALDSAGIPYDRKKFVPHITLVRKAGGNWKRVPAPKGEMTVDKISLMKSQIKDGKPVYTEVFSV